jgi:hypothetical protein
MIKNSKNIVFGLGIINIALGMIMSIYSVIVSFGLGVSRAKDILVIENNIYNSEAEYFLAIITGPILIITGIGFLCYKEWARKFVIVYFSLRIIFEIGYGFFGKMRVEFESLENIIFSFFLIIVLSLKTIKSVFNSIKNNE